MLSKKYREVMGATNPDNADDGQLEKYFALNVQENSVNGSDSDENAKKEIKFFFMKKRNSRIKLKKLKIIIKSF